MRYPWPDPFAHLFATERRRGLLPTVADEEGELPDEGRVEKSYYADDTLTRVRQGNIEKNVLPERDPQARSAARRGGARRHTLGAVEG